VLMSMNDNKSIKKVGGLMIDVIKSK
jgi:hypothetical protein